MVTGDDQFGQSDPVRDQHAELPIDPDTGTQARPLHLRPAGLLRVFGGGVLGTALRFAGESLHPHGGSDWPWATFTINLVGAFVLGALLEALARSGDDSGWRQRVRLFAGTGFCGAFTTYSTLALEISLLGNGSHVVVAVGYGVTSVVGGVVAAWLGIVVAADVHRRRMEL
jgi:CrcB protein